MTFRNPPPVGTSTSAPLRCTWELLIEVVFVPALAPTRIDRLRERAWEHVEAAVAAVLAPHLLHPPSLALDPVRGRGPTTPLFPMVVGNKRLTCHLDAVFLVEGGDVPADLRQVAYDAVGHAYELGVEVVYRRCPKLDATRPPPPPEDARAARVRRRRTRLALPRKRAPRPDG